MSLGRSVGISFEIFRELRWVIVCETAVASGTGHGYLHRFNCCFGSCDGMKNMIGPCLLEELLTVPNEQRTGPCPYSVRSRVVVVEGGCLRSQESRDCRFPVAVWILMAMPDQPWIPVARGRGVG